MDTTEQHIKMCEKAVELQNLWKRENMGDWFMGWAAHDIEKPNEAPGLLMVGEMLWYEAIRPKRNASVCFCVFRQDQLQEMVFAEDSHPLSRRIDMFHSFYFPWNELGVMPHPRAVREAEAEEKYILQFTSMEQLWLAFVMKEKFGKYWNGEDWIKQ